MSLFQLQEFLEQRDSKRIYKGIVVENNDPKKIGRVKVFIKGCLEGSTEDLPWCSPQLPSIHGGSPSNMSFAVPEIGAVVAVVFQGDTPYVPSYIGTWVGESMSPTQLFGEDYPNTSGTIEPSGSFLRTNNLSNYTEYHHASGAMLRVNNRGDIEIVSPKNMLMRVDGEYAVNTNYWQSGGGGMGNILEELQYALLDGPFIQGLLDMIALLPGNGDTTSPDYISVEDFANDLEDLVEFANSLNNLDPEFLGLEDLMSLIDNRARIRRAFQAFNGIEGLVNMLFSFFGMFGVWNSAWLNNSEDELNAVLNSLESPSSMKLVLLGNPKDLEAILGYPPSRATTAEQLEEVTEAQSKVTADVIKKIIDGFTALATVSPTLKSCEELRKSIESGGMDNARLIIASLPEDLNKFVLDTIYKLFKELTAAIVDINPRSQLAFLDRFGLGKYFSMTNATTEMVRGVVKELIGLGVDRFELGMNGHLVGRAIIQDQEGRNDSIEQLKRMAKDLGWDPNLIDSLLNNLTVTLRKRLDQIDIEVDTSDTEETEGEEDEEDKFLCSLSDLISAMVGYGFHKDLLMEFVDNLDLEYPVAEYNEISSDGTVTRKIRYIGPASVKSFLLSVYELRNDSSTSGGEEDQEGTGDDDGFYEPSLAEDLESMGEGTGGKGLKIPGSFLSYLGGAIGDLCRASSFASEASKFLGEDLAAKLDELPPEEQKKKRKKGDEPSADKSVVTVLAEVYKWFIPATIPGLSKRINENVLAKEVNSFLVGLDPHGLFKAVVPYMYLEVFIKKFVTMARPRASFAYGSNIHQIVASGMIDLVTEDLEKRLADIEKYVYKRDPAYVPQPPFYEESESLSEGPYYPKTYWYSLLFGCPMMSTQPGYASMYKRARSLDTTSRRMVRLGKWFRSSNLQYVENETSSGEGVSVTQKDVDALKVKPTE